MKTSALRNLLFGLILATACGGPTKVEQVQTGTKDTGGLVTNSQEAPPLALDSRIRTGVLDNGLTYYVLEHQVPEKRAQLWLGVNAGSVLEDDDQQGLAHFVEHMAFNGTKKYQKLAIVNYLESIGMKFGPDLNAYTSFDETVYMLQVPTDDQEIVTKGLDILHEWAGAIAFEPEEVDKERGVVTEEWRLGQGAGMRIANKQYPLLFSGSKYGQRLPIGKPEILKNAPTETLVRFYKDWYRPDLMAIVAVGDFDGAKMEAAIKAKFADLENPAQPRAREQEKVPVGTEPIVQVTTDKEMPQTTVTVHTKIPRRPMSHESDLRRSVAESLYHMMLGARLREVAQSADAPFMFAFTSTSGFVRGGETYQRFALVKDGRIEDALRVLGEESRRVELHGFTETELTRAKEQIRRRYQQSVEEQHKKNGRALAAEILRNFFTDEAMPGITAELAMLEKALPGIKLDELNQMAKEWGDPNNQLVMISGPESLKAPSKEAVLATLDKASKSSPAAYSDEVNDQPLMAKAPSPGKVTATKEIEAIGVTEWTLSNGVKVVVKPTDFKNDEVQMLAISPGGHSLVPDSELFTARFASQIVALGGIGEHSAIELGKKLSGKLAQVSAMIFENQEEVRGNASAKDLKTLMELTHLSFTAPRADENAFATWKTNTSEFLKNRRTRPESAFREDWSLWMTNGHFRSQPFTQERLDGITLEGAIKIYKERFADASDFTFVFVGNIDPNTFQPMVETYLGSLPSKKGREKHRDTKEKLRKGKSEKAWEYGLAKKGRVHLTFHGKEKWSPETKNNMSVLSGVLQTRLREVLREDLGGVYGVGARGQVYRLKKHYQFEISFGCDPDRIDELKKAVFDTIKTVSKEGVEQSYIDKVVSIRKRQRELQLKDNSFWASELATAYHYGEDPADILDESLLTKASVKQVKAAAKKYLGKQFLLGILKPSAEAAKEK